MISNLSILHHDYAVTKSCHFFHIVTCKNDSSVTAKKEDDVVKVNLVGIKTEKPKEKPKKEEKKEEAKEEKKEVHAHKHEKTVKVS